ncbi:MAG: endo-1,4-beta-xylanase [Thermostichus sp. DRC_bins_24]
MTLAGCWDETSPFSLQLPSLAQPTYPASMQSLSSVLPASVGMAFGLDQIQSNSYAKRILLREVDRFTSTDFFMSHLIRQDGSIDFTNTDQVVELALSHGKSLHAHALLYGLPAVSPDYLLNFSGGNKAFEAYIQNYIHRVVSRYRGKVVGYDVFNELFEYNSGALAETWLRKRYPDNDSFIDFVGKCFTWAHEADPEAVLFYNDYGQEFTSRNYEKLRAQLNLIQALRRKGIPISGFGIQAHTTIYRSISDFEFALSEAAKTGLSIHLSELDVSVNYRDFAEAEGGELGLTQLTEELARRQAKQYRDILQAYYRIVPKDQQYGVTFWDISDGDTWLLKERLEWPCLFDAEYQPKPAYFSILGAFSTGFSQ